MFDPINFTITDPRGFAGDPYEVAAHAVAQLDGLLDAALQLQQAAFLMARNAEMERNLAQKLPPAGSEFASGPQGRKWQEVQDSLSAAKAMLKPLGVAAAYNPKHPAKS